MVNDPGVAADGSGGDAGVAAAVAAEITAAGGEAIADTGDVTDWHDTRRMVEAAVEAFGDLHIVVNNAAIEVNKPMERLTEREFDDVLAVKVKGTFAVSRWAALHWRERHRAGDRTDRAIINTASGSGLRNPLPGQSNYAAGNAAVAALTIVHALELGPLLGPGQLRQPLDGAHPADRGGARHGRPRGRRRLRPARPGRRRPRRRLPRHRRLPAHRPGPVRARRPVTLEEGWSPGPHVDRPDAAWTVAELAAAMRALPHRDPFDRLAESLSGALGAAGRARLQEMINAQLDAPTA